MKMCAYNLCTLGEETEERKYILTSYESQTSGEELQGEEHLLSKLRITWKG